MVGGGGDKKMECPILPKAQTQKYPYWIWWSFTLDYWGKYLPGIRVTCGDHSLLHFEEYWLSTETKYCNILSRVSH